MHRGGLDTASGRIHDPHVRAAATLTLAAPKVGLRGVDSVGELYLGDISVPLGVFASLGFEHLGGLNKAPVVRVTT